MVLTDGVQTDGDVLAEANRAREFGVKVFTVPYHRPVPGEVALRELRVPDKVRVGEPFTLHAQIFSSRPQAVKAVLKQGEAINGLDGVRTVNLVAGENDVPFKSVVRVAGEVTYQLELSEIPEDRRGSSRFTSRSMWSSKKIWRVECRLDRDLRRNLPIQVVICEPSAQLITAVIPSCRHGR